MKEISKEEMLMTPGEKILQRIQMVMEDDSIIPRHKTKMLSEIESLYNSKVIASMVKPLVQVPYEKGVSYEGLLNKLFPHLNHREARSRKGYLVKMALRKIRENGAPIETVWRPTDGYRICVPNKDDRLYLIARRVWPLMAGMQRWEDRLKGEDIAPKEIETFKKELKEQIKKL